MLNIGIILRAIPFLKYITDSDVTKQEFCRSFPTFAIPKETFIASIHIIALCRKCKWIIQTKNGYMKPSSRGKELLGNADVISRLRAQVKDIVHVYRPPWLPLVKRGRNEVKRRISANERQCFETANLFSECNLETIAWWDNLILASYSKDEKRRQKTGRQGEFLSMIYEEKRIGRKPKLVSIDVNYAGYDILSQVDKENSASLLIEVKCSRSAWKKAQFYLSRNEWQVITNNESALVHLWALHSGIQFSSVTSRILRDNIPTDAGKGEWTNVQIPYSIASPKEDRFLRRVIDEIDDPQSEQASYYNHI